MAKSGEPSPPKQPRLSWQARFHIVVRGCNDYHACGLPDGLMEGLFVTMTPEEQSQTLEQAIATIEQEVNQLQGYTVNRTRLIHLTRCCLQLRKELGADQEALDIRLLEAMETCAKQLGLVESWNEMSAKELDGLKDVVGHLDCIPAFIKAFFNAHVVEMQVRHKVAPAEFK